jgi:uncharacterized protein YndB with AHSA1/START domain
MKKSEKKLKLKFERLIPASPGKVFDAWLNPKTPGTPWHEGDKLILNPKKDEFFYWLIMGTSHYGRFTKVERSKRIDHTWMSPNTLGEETSITVTFKKKGEGTLMTLLHSNIPDTEAGRSHKDGWNYFLDKLLGHFESGTKKRN